MILCIVANGAPSTLAAMRAKAHQDYRGEKIEVMNGHHFDPSWLKGHGPDIRNVCAVYCQREFARAIVAYRRAKVPVHVIDRQYEVREPEFNRAQPAMEISELPEVMRLFVGSLQELDEQRTLAVLARMRNRSLVEAAFIAESQRDKPREAVLDAIDRSH